MSKNNDLLRAEGINKSFGAVTAAKDINVGIKKGERVSLIGSNGAGKTTFMNMVTGYLKPDTGNIFFKNENITSLNPRVITQKGISRSFQIPQIFEPMSTWENLLVALGTSQKNHSYFLSQQNWYHLQSKSSVYCLSQRKFLDIFRKKFHSQN